MQINVDFPERISTKKYEKNKELVNLIIAEEVRAAKEKETRNIYLEHKNRLRELRMSARSHKAARTTIEGRGTKKKDRDW